MRSIFLVLGLISFMAFKADKKNPKIDDKILGTWYEVAPSKQLQIMTFNADGSFEMSVRGFEMNKKIMKEKGMQGYLKFETDVSQKPHQIKLDIHIVTGSDKPALDLNLGGIYKYYNDTTMVLDMQDASKGAIKGFSSQASLMFKKPNISDAEFEKRVEGLRENGVPVFQD